MHRPMGMRVLNSLHSGSSLNLVAVVAVLSTSKLNFEKLYIQRESITKIMDCVYEVGKYNHHCHQVAKTFVILGFWQWHL